MWDADCRRSTRRRRTRRGRRPWRLFLLVQLSVNQYLGDEFVLAEQIALYQGEIGDLARLDRAEPVVDAEHLSRTQGHCSDSRIAVQAALDSFACIGKKIADRCR